MPLRTSSQHAPGYYGTVATFLPILFNCQRAILPGPRPEGGWLQSAIVITLADCGVCVKWLLVWTPSRGRRRRCLTDRMDRLDFRTRERLLPSYYSTTWRQ